MKRALPALLLLASVASASPAATLPPGPDRALVQAKCTSCHTANRIVRRGRDRAEWTATLTVMRAKGLRMSDDEANRILSYLGTALGPNVVARRH